MGYFLCAICHKEIPHFSNGLNQYNCSCGVEYFYKDNILSYDYKKILYENYKKQFYLNSVLNNNGFLSYHFLQMGSISLSDRKDVIRFRDYILSNAIQGRLLDIGCGIMELPGYLDFGEKPAKCFSFYGIDPIEASFKGVRVVGCSEFMPFKNDYFDTIIFGTSLDHVCSLSKTIIEVNRVLKSKGKVIIWMSDRKDRSSLIDRVKKIFKKLKSFSTRQYFFYPNYTILYKPNGAVDPFHSYNESPDKIIKLMKKNNFKLLNIKINNPNEIFLCFGKKDQEHE